MAGPGRSSTSERGREGGRGGGGEGGRGGGEGGGEGGRGGGEGGREGGEGGGEGGRGGGEGGREGGEGGERGSEGGRERKAAHNPFIEYRQTQTPILLLKFSCFFIVFFPLKTGIASPIAGGRERADSVEFAAH